MEYITLKHGKEQITLYLENLNICQVQMCWRLLQWQIDKILLRMLSNLALPLKATIKLTEILGDCCRQQDVIINYLLEK